MALQRRAFVFRVGRLFLSLLSWAPGPLCHRCNCRTSAPESQEEYGRLAAQCGPGFLSSDLASSFHGDHDVTVTLVLAESEGLNPGELKGHFQEAKGAPGGPGLRLAGETRIIIIIMGRASGELELEMPSVQLASQVLAVSASLLVLKSTAKGRAFKFSEVGIMMVTVTAGRKVGAGHCGIEVGTQAVRPDQRAPPPAGPGPGGGPACQ
jgi:hypothetical protein